MKLTEEERDLLIKEILKFTNIKNDELYRSLLYYYILKHLDI